MSVHHPPSYFNNPPHAISVSLIGCGGTGSQVLAGLARIHHSLQAFNHPGLHVTAFDGDIVSESNIGRQLFSPADIDQPKSTVLISRVNRFYGTGWKSLRQNYSADSAKRAGQTNIYISCVDTAKARRDIAAVLKDLRDDHDERNPLYWMDFGNGHRTGQVVLGTLQKIEQPKSKLTTEAELPSVLEQFPELLTAVDEDEGPSCSIAQALGRQDLFINSSLAQLGCALLWKLLSDVRIKTRGAFLNIEGMQANPIKI